jgi:DnaJ-class molecular chaperone
MIMNTRSCLYCEGHGTKRRYLDRAGDYEVYHCKACDGTGSESVALEKTAHRVALERIALGGLTITEAMRIADKALT